MRRVGVVLLISLCPISVAAQGNIFFDGFEIGNLCRWSEQDPPGDCSDAEIILTLPGDVQLSMIRIPAGVFSMGSPPDERNRVDQEDLHQVTLTQDYYIGKYEVTQAQWAAVMGSTPDLSCFGGPHGVGPENPVYCVSWADIAGAGGFFAQLNAHLNSTGQVTGIRLPTEAEWERAARGGNQHRFSHGDVLDCTDDCESCAVNDVFMWWCGNDDPHGTKPIGTKRNNPFGLYDMHGNMYEWVNDWFTTHLGTAPAVDPTGPTTGDYRVLRGGGWPNDSMYCRSANRFNTTPDDYDYYIGFRVARSAP